MALAPEKHSAPQNVASGLEYAYNPDHFLA